MLKGKLSDVTSYNALNPHDGASFLYTIRKAAEASPPFDWKG